MAITPATTQNLTLGTPSQSSSTEIVAERIIDRIESFAERLEKSVYYERIYRICNHFVSYSGATLPQIEQRIMRIVKQILGFSSEEETPSDSFVFKETRKFNDGSISSLKVDQHVGHLQRQTVTGIRFHKNKIKNTLEDGVCSAKSLEFASQYFKIKEQVTRECVQNPRVNPPLRTEAHLRKIGYRFATSSQTLRNRQMAYDTIECEPTKDHVDYAKNKIQSLANFHGFKITHCSEELDVEGAKESKLLSKISTLPEGTYILRFTVPSFNEKLEEYGHTLIYIKENGLHLLYDPGEGLSNLSGSKNSNLWSAKFKDLLDDWDLDKARFYRIEKPAPAKTTHSTVGQKVTPIRSRL